MPDIVTDANYKDILDSLGLFDNFGDNFIDSTGRANIAWLRTVGGNGTFQIKDNVSQAKLVTINRSVAEFVKRYFENYYSDFDIIGECEVNLND